MGMTDCWWEATFRWGWPIADERRPLDEDDQLLMQSGGGGGGGGIGVGNNGPFNEAGAASGGLLLFFSLKYGFSPIPLFFIFF